jgi:hypothetical protein
MSRPATKPFKHIRSSYGIGMKQPCYQGIIPSKYQVPSYQTIKAPSYQDIIPPNNQGTQLL